MEDDSVTGKDAKYMQYLGMKQRLNKKEFRDGWAKSKIYLSDADLEANYKMAIEWFLENQSYISPEILHHFPKEVQKKRLKFYKEKGLRVGVRYTEEVVV